MPDDTNSPTEFPPMQPLAIELVDCIAVLLEGAGKTRAVFTRDERFSGRVTNPQAFLMDNGDLVVSLRE